MNKVRPKETGGTIHADLCVIGGGSGGLSVAAGAVQMGASVVLVEKAAMGGDCLNTGCVPSKALIAAARYAYAAHNGPRFGVTSGSTSIAFETVHAHVRGVIDAIAPHDSVERFEGLGVSVVRAAARFVSPGEVEAGGRRIRARRFVIATGSRAAMPPVAGLADVPILTNENVFDLQQRPEHLIVIGGGPIGVEMAQAFRRLGSKVTVIERLGLLSRDDPEAVAVVRRALLSEGITIHENASILGVKRVEAGIDVDLAPEGLERQALSGTHVLVAAGRRPELNDLGLEAAEVAFTSKGITVDARLRTSNRRIFAIGDVAGGLQFTHVAGYHAGIVIRNALFGWPAKVNYAALPWVTYTDPELAQVGLTEATAREQGHTITVLTCPFALNDRAQTERRTEGLAKIVVAKGGRILGATIVGPHAGELIGAWGLAISNQLRIGAMAGMIAPYPTLSEISKRAAGSYFSPLLFGARTRSIVGLVQRLLP